MSPSARPSGAARGACAELPSADEVGERVAIARLPTDLEPPELRERGAARALLALRSALAARCDLAAAGDREAAERGQSAARDIARALGALDGAAIAVAQILDPEDPLSADVPTNLLEALRGG